MCLNEVGRSIAYQCDPVAMPDDQACLVAETLCDGRPDGCCEGLTCMGGTDADGKPRLGLCMKPCVEDQNCTSGCCAESAYFGQDYCAAGPAPCIGACKRQNESCLGRNDLCCAGLVCVKSAAEPLLDGCQIPCAKGSECESNCCLLFSLDDESKAETGICAPSDYCK